MTRRSSTRNTDVPSSKVSGPRWWTWSIAALVLVTACGTSEPRGIQYDLRPPGSPGVAHTFEELLTEPDLVVVATVADSRPGRVVGAGENDPGVAFEETTLTIDELWAGDLAVGATVAVETERDASPYDRTWWENGTQVVAFLWRKRDAESAGRFYRPIVPQGILILDGDRLLPAADGDLASEAAALGVAGLHDAVVRARSGS